MIDLMNRWTDVGFEQAIAMLSRTFTLNTFYSKDSGHKEYSQERICFVRDVREFAVNKIKYESRELIDLALPSLVAAIRYGFTDNE